MTKPIKLLPKPQTLSELYGQKYQEVEPNARSESLILIIVLVLGMIFIGFVVTLFGSASPQQQIATGVIVFALAAAFVYHLLDRCPKCNSKYRRFGNGKQQDQLLTVCDSCKVFYRDMAGSGIG